MGPALEERLTLACSCLQLWFAFDNGFSGQILFEKWTIATYNVAFTLLPPLAIGVFDQHLSAETLMNVRLWPTLTAAYPAMASRITCRGLCCHLFALKPVCWLLLDRLKTSSP